VLLLIEKGYKCNKFGDKSMNNRVIYWITIGVSIVYIFLGNLFFTKDINFFEPGEYDAKFVKAEIIEVFETGNEETEDLKFKARLLSKEYKNKEVFGVQVFDMSSLAYSNRVGKGDKILLYENIDADGITTWYADQPVRSDAIIVLGIIFLGLLIIFGRIKGINTIIALIFTCLSIFVVFVPSVISGYNIYIMSVVTAIYIVVMTLIIVYGGNKKSFVAALGCVAGILLSGILTVIMANVLELTGLLDEDSMHLLYINDKAPIDLRAVIFGSIILGAIGAVMDVSMSIASSLNELVENMDRPSFSQIINSGFEIGRDMMGTMSNTLILAYIGSSLSVLLLYCAYNSSFIYLINKEIIIVELLQALIGSIGILTVIPFATFISAKIYLAEYRQR